MKSIDNQKQQAKSLETKRKLFKATVELLKNHDYSSLTVRNICQESGVSTGSFYHHFENKDDLLAYYLSLGFDDYIAEHPIHFGENIVDISTKVYGHYADYCTSMGIDFIGNYYTVQNKALDTYTESHQLDKAQNFILHTIYPALLKAKDDGEIKNSVNIDDVYNEMCMIVKGCIFDWASSGARFELRARIEKLLTYYLNNIVN